MRFVNIEKINHRGHEGQGALPEAVSGLENESTMYRVKLIHWNEEEAEERAEKIRAWGYQVDEVNIDPNSFRAMRQDPPDLVVIDLTRLPSHGRDVGMWVRDTKATRSIPVIFVDGLPEKVERTKQSLPDAIYAKWSKLKSTLSKHAGKKVAKPVVPAHVLAGYSGTPLPKKLGIKPGITVGLVNAPDGISKLLEPLPENVTVKKLTWGRRTKAAPELLIWFPKSASDLETRIDDAGDRFAQGGGVWIAWPKKAAKIETDLTQNLVREIGLASGLVDYKICSINETYSGLKFSRRKEGH